MLATALLLLAVNFIYQVVRKPAELFFPVAGVLHKTPAETWVAYRAIFRAHSTALIPPELLAALAQAESSGNPVARTYWRWRFSTDPFELYRPASSAVGMLQITDGTFAQARRYCIHDHVVVEQGKWHDPKACWFNGLYTRVVPSHAVEMTSAWLDRGVREVLGRHKRKPAPEQQQELAAVIHLCGAAAGQGFARRNFQPALGQRCGVHDLRAYLARVNALKWRFGELAREE